MSQSSLFSADITPPGVIDLGGLLAAHGQVTRTTSGVRLSVLVAEDWRASALSAEFAERGLRSERVCAQGQHLLRTEITNSLDELARAWTKGAVKCVGQIPNPPGGFLRCWALTAGRSDETGYVLGLDPHIPDMHTALAAALSAAGLAASLLGVRAGGPALRIVGRRRLSRLADLLGRPPAGAPAGVFPESVTACQS